MRWILCLSMFCLLGASTCYAGKNDWLVKHPTIEEMLRRTNEVRARSGVGPLILDEQMCLHAYQHACYMADFGMMHSGLPYMEAICQSQTTVEWAINTWNGSPPHNAILHSGTHVGFGFQNRNGRPSWVCVVR